MGKRTGNPPGEDPLLTSRYAVAYARRLQGYTFDGRKTHDYLLASACCKHFAAHDLDNWHGTTRYVFDAEVSKQDLADTFQPPFRRCVQEGQASSIMCAYNCVNGVPGCVLSDLLTETARGQWNFDGYIASDRGAVSIIHDVQGYAETPEDAVADILKADRHGCKVWHVHSLACSSSPQQKKLIDADIDRALIILFSVRIRLGLFDPTASDKLFGNIRAMQVCSQEHRDLALEAARDGIVLLKNTANLLHPNLKPPHLVS